MTLCDSLFLPRTATQRPDVNGVSIACGSHEQLRRPAHESGNKCAPIKARSDKRCAAMVLDRANDLFAAPKVAEFRLHRRFFQQENVGRLDVAVHDVKGVQIGHFWK